jgi:fructokinase
MGGEGNTRREAMLAEHGRLSIEGVSQWDAAALRDLLGFATRAAAITCSRRGADLPRRNEIA